MKMKTKLSTDDLRKAVEHLHSCKARHTRDVDVTEKFGGDTVWDGTVSIFEIEGNPRSNICYAWSHSIDNSNKKRFLAILHVPPIDSPQKAVKAAIVHEYITKD